MLATKVAAPIKKCNGRLREVFGSPFEEKLNILRLLKVIKKTILYIISGVTTWT